MESGIHRWRRPLRAVAPLFVLLADSGCESVFNPHQVPQELYADRLNQGGDGYAGDLPLAINEARAQQELWAKAIAEQSQFRNSISLLMIPMAAAATALGITSTSNASRDAIVGLGVGGAALFGASELLYSQPRQRVWAQGVATIECAISAMDPLLMKQRVYDNLLGSLRIIASQRSRVGAQVATAKAALAEVRQLRSTHPRIPAAEVEITVAESLLTRADRTAKAGDELVGTIDSAGAVLRRTVASIRNRVTVEVIKSEPNLPVVAAAVSGMGDLSRRLSPVPLGGAGTEQVEIGGQQKTLMDEALNRLGQALADLSTTTARLAGAVNVVAGYVTRVSAAAKSAVQLSDCAFKAPASDFMVVPDVTEIVLAPDDSTTFRVSGGTGAPRPTVTGDRRMAVTAKPEIGANGAYIVTVMAGSNARPGQGALVITDGAEANRKTIAIRVVAPAKNGQGGGANDGATALTEFEKALQKNAPEKVRFVQCMAKVNQDGIIGAETRKGVKKWRADQGLPDPDNDKIDEALYEKMKGLAEAAESGDESKTCLALLSPAPSDDVNRAAPAPAGAAPQPAATGSDPGAVESGASAASATVTGDDIADIQNKLVALGHLSADSFKAKQLDAPTCAAIRRFKKASGLKPEDCKLNEATVARLMRAR